MKRIPLIWFNGLPDKDKSKLEDLLKNNSFLVNRLRDLLNARLQKYENEETAPDAYDNPSWAYKQADRAGAKREVKQLLALFDFLK